MKTFKKIIFAAVALLSFPFFASATPSSVDRISNRIEPLIKTDFIQGAYFTGTTTATSTLSGPLYVSNTGSQTGVPVYLRVGSTTVPGYVPNYLADFIDSKNDFLSANVWNTSNGSCATADLTVNNDTGNVTSNFGDLGHTSSSFTGSGCTNNPFTGFGYNSTYLYDPTGWMDFAIGSTSVNTSFNWFAGGYTNANKIMVLTNGGRLGIGTSTPNNALSIQGNAIISGDIVSVANITATGTLKLSALTGTQCLQESSGVISGSGSSCSSSSYPFPLTGNATSTLTQFNNGLTAYATSTIGNGTQGGGLVINGGATTTGGLLVNGMNSTFGIQEPMQSTTNTREILYRGSVSDSGNDAFYIMNATINDGQFGPQFAGIADTSSTRTPLVFRGWVTSANDTGATPLLVYDLQQTSSAITPQSATYANITTRPLVDFQNNDVSLVRFLANGHVGIGTTTSYASLSVQSGTSTGDAFVVATSTGATVGGIDNDGHTFTSGPTPAVTACGAGSPSVVGDDQGGTIITGTAATSCTLTFSKAYRVIPYMSGLSDNSATIVPSVSSISTTAVTFSLGAGLSGGQVYYSINYHK